MSGAIIVLSYKGCRLTRLHLQRSKLLLLLFSIPVGGVDRTTNPDPKVLEFQLYNWLISDPVFNSANQDKVTFSCSVTVYVLYAEVSLVTLQCFSYVISFIK